jgi:hypothetical protein
MKSFKSFVFSVLMLIPISLMGCSRTPIAGITSPEKMTLYSIKPEALTVGSEIDEKDDGKIEQFHGYPVLGKVDVDSLEKRNEIVAALTKGHEQGKSLAQPKCFEPRHGIRVIENGKTIDFVICFHCVNMLVLKGNEDQHLTIPISTHPKPLLDKYLTDHQIPLAPDD